MSKIFFTSDLHFGHENVLRFDNRPFATVEEMDSELIRRWNAKVGRGDLVYVLGDIYGKAETMTHRRSFAVSTGKSFSSRATMTVFCTTPGRRTRLPVSRITMILPLPWRTARPGAASFPTISFPCITGIGIRQFICTAIPISRTKQIWRWTLRMR